MKRLFEAPNMVITEFENENVVTTSGMAAKDVAEKGLMADYNAMPNKPETALSVVHFTW